MNESSNNTSNNNANSLENGYFTNDFKKGNTNDTNDLSLSDKTINSSIVPIFGNVKDLVTITKGSLSNENEEASEANETPKSILDPLSAQSDQQAFEEDSSKFNPEYYHNQSITISTSLDNKNSVTTTHPNPNENTHSSPLLIINAFNSPQEKLLNSLHSSNASLHSSHSMNDSKTTTKKQPSITSTSSSAYLQKLISENSPSSSTQNLNDPGSGAGGKTILTGNSSSLLLDNERTINKKYSRSSISSHEDTQNESNDFSQGNNNNNNKLANNSNGSAQSSPILLASSILETSSSQDTSSMSPQSNNTTYDELASKSPTSKQTHSKSKNYNTSDKDKRKPWYSSSIKSSKKAFVNSYKQKNEDFKKLFKLPPEEHLLVDYSCALQKEILAHGRMYISLNYACFRANIIGWETTLIIKLKDIRSIFKDKTAKIIPNAISVVLDNEKYFFTSFISRDKTFATLFRVWQITLADSSMSIEEINNLLKTSYGEDLGYNSEDAENEFYKNFKSNNNNNNNNSNTSNQTLTAKDKFYRNHQPVSTILSTNGIKEVNHKLFDSADDLNKNRDSFSDDQPRMIPKKKTKIPYFNQEGEDEEEDENDQNGSSSSSQSGSVSSISPIGGSVSMHAGGHRQCSSYDTSMIDSSQSFEANERPKSMVYEKLSAASTEPPQLKKRNSTIETEKQHVEFEKDNQNESNKKPKLQEVNGEVIISTSKAQNDVSINTSLDLPSNETIDKSFEIDNMKCVCNEHMGKEMLSKVFNLNVNYIWECLFGHTTFCTRYWDSRKFYNMKISDWKKLNPTDQLPSRQLEYLVDLGIIGRPSNTESQKIIEYKSNSCIVLESESVTHGVPYSDCFSVRNRFCITRVTAKTSRLLIHSYFNYFQKPSYIARSFIERNALSALKDSYSYLVCYLEENINNEKICHELSSSTLIAKLSFDDDHTTSTEAHSRKITMPIRKNSKDKELYNEARPSTLLSHISGMSNFLEKSNSNDNASKIAKNPSNNTTKALNAQRKSKSNGQPTLTDQVEIQKSKQIKRSSSITTEPNHDDEIVEEEEDLSTNLNQPQISNHSSHSQQLVPIHIPFFKWEINVDTLVRMFIFAMICLMVINGMLYYKLRRIESLADSLRSDPSAMTKISYPINSNHVFTKDSLSEEIFNWRDLITNTLTALEKMENSLKDWDKNLQTRQAQSLNKHAEDL
jgi:hypothetical protein